MFRQEDEQRDDPSVFTVTFNTDSDTVCGLTIAPKKFYLKEPVELTTITQQIETSSAARHVVFIFSRCRLDGSDAQNTGPQV